MKLHVLSGDSLLEPFKDSGIAGEVAVFRECLVDGPLRANSLDEFFQVRSSYLSDPNDEKDGFYESDVRPEIEKILRADAQIEMFLWFENELFCQANLWFLLTNIGRNENVWVVSPETAAPKEQFQTWARLEPDDLRKCFDSPIRVADKDVVLASELWDAFVSRDEERLVGLSKERSELFRNLDVIAIASAKIDSRPRDVLRLISKEGVQDFPEAFREFCRREPVYGFGDLQVKRLWDEIGG